MIAISDEKIISSLFSTFPLAVPLLHYFFTFFIILYLIERMASWVMPIMWCTASFIIHIQAIPSFL